MSFGTQLRRRREELGVSRGELAEQLGVSRSAIGNYETGVSTPKEEVLLQLFDAQDRFCPEPLQMPARLPEISYDVPWEKFDQAAAFSRSWLQATLQKAKEMLQ